MSFLNENIPHFNCLLRQEYIYNHEEGQGLYIPATAFAVCSIQTRAIGFHVMTENGAIIERMPVSALCTKPNEKQDHSVLELWDCFSYHVAVIRYGFLRDLSCTVKLKDGKSHEGRYMFTVDWAHNEYADNPGEGGHKCAHIIELDNGNIAAQPNNRIRWHEAATLQNYDFPHPPKTNTYVYQCETKDKWITEDSDHFEYAVQGRDGKPIVIGNARSVEPNCVKKKNKKKKHKNIDPHFLVDPDEYMRSNK